MLFSRLKGTGAKGLGSTASWSHIFYQEKKKHRNKQRATSAAPRVRSQWISQKYQLHAVSIPLPSSFLPSITFWFSLTPATMAWSKVSVPQIPWVHTMSWARLLYAILIFPFSGSILHQQRVEGTALSLRCPVETHRHNQTAEYLCTCDL